MSRRSASRRSMRAARLRLALCPLPKAAPSPGTLPSVQVSGIHPSTSQSGTLVTLVVPFSLRHYHGKWQSFPRRPLLVGACQGPLVVFPASHHLSRGGKPCATQMHHRNRRFVAPRVPSVGEVRSQTDWDPVWTGPNPAVPVPVWDFPKNPGPLGPRSQHSHIAPDRLRPGLDRDCIT